MEETLYLAADGVVKAHGYSQFLFIAALDLS